MAKYGNAKMNITLKQGNCLELFNDIESGSVDMVCADPPYGITACEWDSIIPLEPMWTQLKRIIKPNGAIVMTASQPFTTILISSNMDWFKYEWIWEKNRGSNFANIKYQPFREHENIIIFCKKSTLYNAQKIKNADSSLKRDPVGTERIANVNRIDVATYGFNRFSYRHIKLNGLRSPSSIVKFNVPSGKESVKHPTQKPVALMEYLIKTYTNKGDTVLDFCMGSGTTGVAAVKLGRNFIGYELEKKYFELAECRIYDASSEHSALATNLFNQNETIQQRLL